MVAGAERRLSRAGRQNYTPPFPTEREMTSDMATATASVVWVDGEFVSDEQQSHRVQVRLGASLGISPVAYVRGGSLLDAHARTLALAATTLGYDGADIAVLMAVLAPLGDALHAVSLVPTLESHRATPPGTDWMFDVRPFEPPLIAGRSLDGVRLTVGEFRRNQTSPAANVLLRDDADLAAGASRDPQVDATLWLDLDGHVACADQHCVVAEIGGRLCTPALDHAALRTAWRHSLVSADTSAVVEQAVTLDDLLAADAVVCVTPWGQVLPVSSLDERSYDTTAPSGSAATIFGVLR